MMHNVDNTKALARVTGVPVRRILEICWDLNIAVHYRFDLHQWEIANRAEARMLLDHLQAIQENVY